MSKYDTDDCFSRHSILSEDIIDPNASGVAPKLAVLFNNAKIDAWPMLMMRKPLSPARISSNQERSRLEIPCNISRIDIQSYVLLKLSSETKLFQFFFNFYYQKLDPKT